jgi:hypothetical protein
MADSADALDDRLFMDALFDLLVPADESRDLPGAGSLDLSAEAVRGVRSDPLLGPFVEAGTEALRDAALAEHPEGLAGMTREAGTKLLQSVLSAHPIFVMGLLRHLYPAFYANPKVLEGIGVPPRPPFPEGFDVQPTDPELLAILQARRKSA